MIPQLSAEDLNEILQEKNSLDVLDLRPVSEFLSGFIPGSINLPEEESNFIGNLRKIWPEPRDVVLITGESTIPDDVLSAVKEVGGTVKGFVSYQDWEQAGYITFTLDSVRIEDVLENKEQYELVDVRTEEEWRKNHIPGSYNIPLVNLSVLAHGMDRAKKYVAFCAGVYRGMAGAARLRSQGFDVLYLPGGVSAWDTRDGTIEKGLHS